MFSDTVVALIPSDFSVVLFNYVFQLSSDLLQNAVTTYCKKTEDIQKGILKKLAMYE